MKDGTKPPFAELEHSSWGTEKALVGTGCVHLRHRESTWWKLIPWRAQFKLVSPQFFQEHCKAFSPVFILTPISRSPPAAKPSTWWWPPAFSPAMVSAHLWKNSKSLQDLEVNIHYIHGSFSDLVSALCPLNIQPQSHYLPYCSSEIPGRFLPQETAFPIIHVGNSLTTGLSSIHLLEGLPWPSSFCQSLYFISFFFL